MSANLDLPRAVGKLITGKVEGTAIGAGHERAIKDGIMSGVTLFKDNAGDLRQLFDLIWRMHMLAGEGFFVAVDQEGGAVQRFDDVITPLPSAMALAALHDEQQVGRLMETAAQQLRLLGVNCNLTPVLDVNSNPMNPIIGTRAFGDDVETVIKLGSIVARAHERQGVLPVGKHFPGHGDTAQDSHLALAVSHADKELLHRRELKPFAECARSLPAMLIGHVWLPAYEKESIPATLSYRVATELLRNELHFGGFLLTDDLPVMKAIMDHWGLEEASIMAINAGADNLLVSGTLEQIESVHRALVGAVESGHVKEERIKQAIERRQQALAVVCCGDAMRHPVTGTGGLQPAFDELSLLLEPGLKLAQQTSVNSIALLRGRVPHIHPGSGEWVLIVPDHPRYKLDLLSALARHLPATGVSLHERRYPLDPDSANIDEISTFATGKQCLMLTFRGLLHKQQLALANKLSQVVSNGTVVAVDVPYELAALPAWRNALATFDPSDLAIESLAHICTAKAQPRGCFPVSMPAHVS